MTTIREVAERAGVSASTVSRVLNDPNYRCAEPGVREKIWQSAMEMNYTPNESARSLKLGRAGQDAPYFQVLMTRAGAESENDPFFRELLHDVETEIADNHCVLADIQYRVELSDDKRCASMNRAAQVRKMRASAGERCDGIIVIGKCNRLVLREIHGQYANVVAINRNTTEYEVDEVLCDGRKVAALAVERLMELGHRRIGYVGFCHNESRYRGYQATLREHGMDLIPDYVIETRQTEEEGYRAMRTFLARTDMPTAFYCANDLTAIGMLRCLSSMKKLPYRPSVIASDDIEAAQTSSPMLTTVNVPKREMAHLAVQLLLDRQRGGHERTVRIEVEGRLVERSSCFPISEQES